MMMTFRTVYFNRELIRKWKDDGGFCVGLFIYNNTRCLVLEEGVNK